MKNTNKVVSLF